MTRTTKLFSALCLFCGFSYSSFASTPPKTDALTDVVPPFEESIKQGISSKFPFYVYSDSSLYILENAYYDDYYKVLKGDLKAVEKDSAHAYPKVELSVSGYSILSDDKAQIRLLDIEESNIVYPAIKYKIGQKPCGDRLILKNGDTLIVRVAKVETERIEYQKCTQIIKRVYSKDKYKVSKIIYANGSVQEFDTKYTNDKNQAKKAYALKIVALSFAFCIVSAFCVFAVQTYHN